MKSIFSTATTAISQAGERTKRAAEKATRASLESVAQATNATKELFTHEEKIKKVLENDKILVRLKGNVWKRRGGVSGKLASYATAWELRPFVLKGSALLYYEKSSSSISSQKRRSSSTKTTTETNNNTNNEDNANNNDDQEEFVFPRGFLDLVEEGASVQASLGHSAGAPSPFCISIKVAISVGGMVNTAQQETKWKLCFDSHATMMEWLVAMSDVVVRSSVDAYNHALLQSADPNSRINPYLKPPPVYEPTSSVDAKNIQQHRLWMMEFYRVQSSLLEHNNHNHNHSNTSTTTASTAIDNSLQVMNTLLSEKEKQRKHLEEKLNELSTQHQTLQTQLEETIKAKDKIQDEKKFMDSLLEQLRIVLEERDTTIAKLQEQQQQQQQHQTTTFDGEDNKDDDTDKDASIQRLTQENQELKASMELKIQALQEELFRSKQQEQEQEQQQGYDEFSVVVEKKEEEEIVNTSTAATTTTTTTTTTPTTAAFLYRLDTESFDDDEFEDCVEN